jgi:uncharacterized cofD-like protein
MAEVKAVFFDLDDTLFDCSGSLIENARKRAARAMVEAGLPVSDKRAYEMQISFYKKFGPMENIFDRMCESLGCTKDERRKIVKAGYRAYNSDQVENIKLFKDAISTLRKLGKKGIKLVLITSGIYERQLKKIKVLGLENEFDLVFVHDIEKDPSKYNKFVRAMKTLGLRPRNIIAIGDKVSSEIRMANRLGMISVRILKGRFSGIKPRNDLEVPDYVVRNLAGLFPLIKRVSNGRAKASGIKVVAIGGGTGLPSVLAALKGHTKKLTAIVTVTDSGRSTGKLRREFGIPAVGDLRNCLIALSDSEKLMLDLFNYRFEGRLLKDMSFGNLFIVALAKATGSFKKAVKAASKILAVKGRVLPSTLENVHVCSELKDGTLFCDENALIQRRASPKKLAERSPIKRIFLKPANVRILPEAKKAILEADLIVIGPGSLFTSVITNLLVKGMKEAIKKSKGKKVYIANVMTQVNQTHGFKLSDHVKAIEAYLGKNVLDFVVFNSRKPSSKILKKYEEEQSFFVENDLRARKRKPLLVGADIIEKPSFSKKKASKQQLLRHNEEKLASVLMGLVS